MRRVASSVNRQRILDGSRTVVLPDFALLLMSKTLPTIRLDMRRTVHALAQP
jgi:hypothetical protein